MGRLIDADRALEIVRDQGLAHPNADHLTNYATLILREAPTVDAAPVRHGRWILRGGKRYCSECGNRACVTRDSDDFWYTVGTDFCPSCGAKMDGGSDG